MLGEVLNYVCTEKTIKVNKDIIALGKKIEQARVVLSQKLMKEPSLYELSSFLEISEDAINKVIMYNQSIDSLDRIINEDGREITILDTIKDSRYEDNINNIALKDEINKLSLFEKRIIYGRYYEDKTQTEMSSELGVNQVYISRSEKKILKKIKNNMSYNM